MFVLLFVRLRQYNRARLFERATAARESYHANRVNKRPSEYIRIVSYSFTAFGQCRLFHDFIVHAKGSGTGDAESIDKSLIRKALARRGDKGETLYPYQYNHHCPGYQLSHAMQIHPRNKLAEVECPIWRTGAAVWGTCTIRRTPSIIDRYNLDTQYMKDDKLGRHLKLTLTSSRCWSLLLSLGCGYTRSLSIPISVLDVLC